MIINPLQALNTKVLTTERQISPILESVEDAEQTCNEIYRKLTARTKKLATESLKIEFSWRVRVGGMRGFRELLLPVFHPVYGVPYLPASSLKGAILAQAKKDTKKGEISLTEVKRILGDIDEGIGTVQILDAFPTEPCLSTDIVNPQWTWQNNNRVKYDPVPHFFLSMEKPEILIGLMLTSKGKNQSADLITVKNWLKKALQAGIGSRVNAGYGRANAKANLPYSGEYHFQFYSQGVYGAFPPNKDNQWNGDVEFRPIALRGILRYWFRAIALGLYDIQTSKRLENRLFGQLNQESTTRLDITLSEEDLGDSKRKEPYYCQGEILLEAKNQKDFELIESLLKFASHIGGFAKSSRRPLHLNNRRLRGCFWELSDFILPCVESDWQIFIQDVLDCFRAIQPQGNPANHSLGNQQNRYQDVFDDNSRIFLIPSTQLKYPSEVDDWYREGYKKDVLGEGLNLLYSSDCFKGFNNQTNRGNADVGGKLGIPSYVWIKSNYPDDDDAYQVVTIFGVNHPQRNNFANAMSARSIQVW